MEQKTATGTRAPKGAFEKHAEVMVGGALHIEEVLRVYADRKEGSIFYVVFVASLQQVDRPFQVSLTGAPSRVKRVPEHVSAY